MRNQPTRTAALPRNRPHRKTPMSRRQAHRTTAGTSHPPHRQTPMSRHQRRRAMLLLRQPASQTRAPLGSWREPRPQRLAQAREQRRPQLTREHPRTTPWRSQNRCPPISPPQQPIQHAKPTHLAQLAQHAETIQRALPGRCAEPIQRARSNQHTEPIPPSQRTRHAEPRRWPEPFEPPQPIQRPQLIPLPPRQPRPLPRPQTSMPETSWGV